MSLIPFNVACVCCVFLLLCRTPEPRKTFFSWILSICICSIKGIIHISKVTEHMWNASEHKCLPVAYKLFLYIHLQKIINNPSRCLALWTICCQTSQIQSNCILKSDPASMYSNKNTLICFKIINWFRRMKAKTSKKVQNKEIQSRYGNSK